MKITVKSMGQAFEDGSGFPVVIQAGRFSYRFDFLGEVRCSLVSGPKCFGSRETRIRESAQRQAKAAYSRMVDALGQDWKAKSVALYSEAA